MVVDDELAKLRLTEFLCNKVKTDSVDHFEISLNVSDIQAQRLKENNDNWNVISLSSFAPTNLGVFILTVDIEVYFVSN